MVHWLPLPAQPQHDRVNPSTTLVRHRPSLTAHQQHSGHECSAWGWRRALASVLTTPLRPGRCCCLFKGNSGAWAAQALGQLETQNAAAGCRGLTRGENLAGSRAQPALCFTEKPQALKQGGAHSHS